MGLSIVFAGLKKSVSKFTAEYEAGRARQPELAPYASAASLLDALKLSSPLTDEARDAIVLALIAEQQGAAHPLWQSLILAAFEPMLRRLCGRVGGGVDKEEMEQRTLMAFLEAAQEVSLVHPPSRAALHLKRATERAVWRTRREARRDAAMAEFDEESLPCRSIAEPVAIVQCVANEVAKILSKDGNGKELLDVFAATSGGGETLRAYVDRVHTSASEEERSSVYVRLQKQRHRALCRLHARVGGRAWRVTSP